MVVTHCKQPIAWQSICIIHDSLTSQKESEAFVLELWQGEERQQPLSLATVKGYTGHQEAGAGVAGLMEALNLVSLSSIPPALHLRNLNPHVAATLQGRAVGIARGGPAPLGQVSASGLLVTGVSSFGAQGTNAHALVRGANSVVAVREGYRADLQTSRCWVAPPAQVHTSLNVVANM